jgi:KinB signaling pathway activation protein
MGRRERRRWRERHETQPIGEMKVMSLGKWFRLFWSTLWIGAAAGLVTGALLALIDGGFRGLTAIEIGYNLLMMLMAGMTFSILSQMFFFAYMILNYVARGLFRKRNTWVLIQLFFILTVPFEIYFFVWESSLPAYLLFAGLLMAASLATAWLKVRETNGAAWVPTVFFMLVFTMVEAAIALQVNLTQAIVLMTVPLLACNAWQIMRLHKLVGRAETGRPAEA